MVTPYFRVVRSVCVACIAPFVRALPLHNLSRGSELTHREQLFGFDTGSIGSLISMPLFEAEFGSFGDVSKPCAPRSGPG